MRRAEVYRPSTRLGVDKALSIPFRPNLTLTMRIIQGAAMLPALHLAIIARRAVCAALSRTFFQKMFKSFA